MKKIILALSLSVIMVMGFTACGSQNSSDNSGDSGKSITVSVSIDFPGDSDSEDISGQKIEVKDGAMLLEVMKDNFDVETEAYSGGEGVGAINGVAQDGSAGWVYTVNEEVIMDYPDAYQVKDGDAIQWTYTSM